jgi:hypothetical protein
MYQGRQMAGTIRAPLKGPIVSTALLHVDDMRWKNGYILLNGDISFADGGEWKKRVRRSSDNIASPTSTPIKKSPNQRNTTRSPDAVNVRANRTSPGPAHTSTAGDMNASIGSPQSPAVRPIFQGEADFGTPELPPEAKTSSFANGDDTEQTQTMQATASMVSVDSAGSSPKTSRSATFVKRLWGR